MLEKRYFIAPPQFNMDLSATREFGVEVCMAQIAQDLDNAGVCATLWACFGVWQGEEEPSICVSVVSDDSHIFYMADLVIKEYKIKWGQKSVFVVLSQVEVGEL